MKMGSQYDYTNGQLPELVDVIIEEKASLFVCAIGIPPKAVVDKLHRAGIPVMNVNWSLKFSAAKLLINIL
jgi:NAD(P)H-dependent flavin oxidoreductase YrpB (nitropropane dioxygenase family)